MERTQATPARSRPFCDLVMKGGITGGIVYPEAIYEISREFNLKSIGGTSAGAIAASLAAAAQYRRVRAAQSPDGEAGYERVRAIPDALGAQGHLFKLFAPNRATKPLFGIIADLFAPSKPRWVKALCLIRAYPAYSALGLIPAAFYAYAAFAVGSPAMRVVHWLVALVVAAIGMPAASLTGLLWDCGRKIPKNCYGLVTGIDDGNPGNELALSAWLTMELEETAGLVPGEMPLTFGMLWDPAGLPGPCLLEEPPSQDDRAINLQMVTTSVTEGRPYQFPTKTSRFYFKPEELAKFFPKHVVRWLVDHARTNAAPLEGLVPLPPIGDLPIVVATRMSLAFPILLSALPLHAVDDGDPAPQRLQTVWFSDGGLTSNFPIQMFDSPLPRWPTLALNLGTFGPQTPADGATVAEGARTGQFLPFTPITGLASFFTCMFAALQNWNDNLQSTLPGFRDRIATIALAPGEGGLNLDMDRVTIERLRQRGADAARDLVRRFAAPSDLGLDAPIMSWESHRWTRLRVEFETLGGHLARFASAYRTPWRPNDVSYSRLITADDPRAIPMRSYPLGDGVAGRAGAERLAAHAAILAAEFGTTPSIHTHVPKPTASLVVRPDLDR
jgi:predicted acylesterase/phospholipase RssA